MKQVLFKEDFALVKLITESLKFAWIGVPYWLMSISWDGIDKIVAEV